MTQYNKYLQNKILPVALILFIPVVLYLGRYLLIKVAVQQIAVPYSERLIPGLNLNIGSVNSDLFSYIHLKDITLSRHLEDGSDIEATLPNLEFSFALSDLKTGFETLIANAHIQAEASMLTANIEDSSASTSFSPKLVLPTLSVPLPEISLKYNNLAITFSQAKLTSKSGKLLSKAVPKGQENPSLPIHLTADHILLVKGPYKKEVSELSAKAVYTSGDFELSSLKADGKNLVETLQLKSQDNHATLQGTFLLGGGSLALEADISEEVRARFSSSGVSLDTLPLAASTGSAPQNGIVEGKGQLSFPFGHLEKITGNAFISLSKTTIFSIPFDQLLLQAQADKGELVVSEFLAANRNNSFHLEKIQLPLTELLAKNWPQLVSQAAGQFEVSINDLTEFAEILPDIPGKYVTRYGINRLKIKGQYANGILSVPAGSIKSKNDTIIVRSLESNFRDWKSSKGWQQIPVKADLQIDTNGADFLKEFISKPSELTGNMQAAIALEGLLGSPELSFTLSASDVTLNSLDVEKITTHGNYQNNKLTLDSLTMVNSQDIVKGDLIYQTGQSTSLKANLDFNLAAIENYLPGAISRNHPVRGDMSGRLTIGRQDGKLYSEGYIRSNSFFYGEKKIEQLKIDLKFSDNDLLVEEFRANWPDQQTKFHSSFGVTFTSKWDQFTATIKELSASRQGHTLSLQDPAEVVYASEKISTNKPLVFKTESATFTVNGALSADTIHLDLAGNIRDGKVFMEPFETIPFFFQSADFSVTVKQSLNNPVLDFAGSIKQIQATSGEAPPLDSTFSFGVREETLKIDKFIISDGVSPRLNLQGVVPVSVKNHQLAVKDGPLRLIGDFNLQSSPVLPWLFQKTVHKIGHLQGSIDIQGTWQKPIGQFQLNADELLLKNIPSWLPPEPITVRIDLSAEKNKLTLKKGLIDSTIASLQVHGTAANTNFLKGFDLANSKQAYSDTEIDLQGSSVLKEMNWLANHYEELRRVSGLVDADFQITGTVAEPQFMAGLSLRDGKMRMNNDMPPLQDIIAKAELNNSVVKINQFSGNLGGAPIQLHGELRLPETDNPPSVDLAVSGENLLFYRADGIKFRGDTSLSLQGNYEQPKLDGHIALTDARVTRNIDFVSSLLSGLTAKDTPAPRFPALTTPPLNDARLYIKVTSKEPISIANNVMKGKVVPDLELHGTGEVPYLSGNLYINDASLTLPAGRIKIASGIINFSQTDPDRPTLELNGEAKMLGYDISVGISGPYDAPVIMLSSTPSLPNEDLLMLLLAGKRPTAESSQQSQNYSNVVMYFGKNLIKTLFPEDETAIEDSLLDRLQLEIGKNISQQGEETIEAQFTLAENIKKGRNAVLLTGEKDAWDKYNGGLRLVFKFH